MFLTEQSIRGFGALRPRQVTRTMFQSGENRNCGGCSASVAKTPTPETDVASDFGTPSEEKFSLQESETRPGEPDSENTSPVA